MKLALCAIAARDAHAGIAIEVASAPIGCARFAQFVTSAGVAIAAYCDHRSYCDGRQLRFNDARRHTRRRRNQRHFRLTRDFASANTDCLCRRIPAPYHQKCGQEKPLSHCRNPTSYPRYGGVPCFVLRTGTIAASGQPLRARSKSSQELPDVIQRDQPRPTYRRAARRDPCSPKAVYTAP